MRYNLDLSHAEDLPINSLGRRVRTRLYFTSEVYISDDTTSYTTHSHCAMLKHCWLLFWHCCCVNHAASMSLTDTSNTCVLKICMVACAVSEACLCF
jgi:hypothetical protein